MPTSEQTRHFNDVNQRMFKNKTTGPKRRSQKVFDDSTLLVLKHAGWPEVVDEIDLLHAVVNAARPILDWIYGAPMDPDAKGKLEVAIANYDGWHTQEETNP